LTHSTLFGGESTTKPITLVAKFSNISSDIISQKKEIGDVIETDVVEDNSIPVRETIPNETVIENISSNSSLGVGIIIGIAIGVAIGIVFVFIIRQKSSK